MFLRVAAVVTAAIFVASIFSHVPVAKADGVTVVSSSGMLGSGGYRIAGELRNDGIATVGNIAVTASLLDSYGNLMSSISGGTFIKTLRPGEKSAFVLSLADAKVGSRVASYKLDTAWNSGVDKPSTLKVSASNGYYDGAGAYHLDGQVSNVGLTKAKDVVVSAALYDKDGRPPAPVMRSPFLPSLRPAQPRLSTSSTTRQPEAR